MEKILHPIKSIQKWALKKLLQKAVNNLPATEEKLKEIWKSHEDEIWDKVMEAIKTTVINIVSKALEKQNNKINNTSQK